MAAMSPAHSKSHKIAEIIPISQRAMMTMAITPMAAKIILMVSIFSKTPVKEIISNSLGFPLFQLVVRQFADGVERAFFVIRDNQKGFVSKAFFKLRFVDQLDLFFVIFDRRDFCKNQFRTNVFAVFFKSFGKCQSKRFLAFRAFCYVVRRVENLRVVLIIVVPVILRDHFRS